MDIKIIDKIETKQKKDQNQEIKIEDKRELKEVPIFNKYNLDISDIASGDTSRIISNLYIDNERTVATDGRMLIEVSTKKVSKEDLPENIKPTELTHPVILEKDAVKQLLSSIPKKVPYELLKGCFVSNLDDNTAEFVITDLYKVNSSILHIVEGSYPDIDRVKPRDSAKFSITLNPEMLYKIAKKFKDFGYIDIEFRDPEEPIVMKAEKDGQKIEALIMPIRKY